MVMAVCARGDAASPRIHNLLDSFRHKEAAHNFMYIDVSRWVLIILAHLRRTVFMRGNRFYHSHVISCHENILSAKPTGNISTGKTIWSVKGKC